MHPLVKYAESPSVGNVIYDMLYRGANVLLLLMPHDLSRKFRLECEMRNAFRILRSTGDLVFFVF